MTYNASPFAQPPGMLLTGNNFYFFGSKKTGQPNTRIAITSISANGSNIATVVGTILEGPVPIIGNLITIQGISTAAYNVTNVALTNVVLSTNSDGTVVLTFACTTSLLAQTLASGFAIVPIAEVAEALTNNSSSVQCAVQSPTGQDNNAKTVTWQTSYPSVPGSITATLQASLVDIDSEYSTVDTSTALAGEIRNVTLDGGNFLRVRITNLTGAAPTGIIKLCI